MVVIIRDDRGYEEDVLLQACLTVGVQALQSRAGDLTESLNSEFITRSERLLWSLSCCWLPLGAQQVNFKLFWYIKPLQKEKFKLFWARVLGLRVPSL